jgi:O-antigen/teichoic acid export membrane protein
MRPDGGLPAVATSDHGRKVTIATNAINLVLGQVGTTTLAIIFSATLGRKLGPGDFGLYFLVTTFANFTYVVVDWGQQFYLIREVARRPDKGGDLLGTALAMRAAFAIALALPAALVAWALGYDLRTRWYSLAFIAVALPLCLSQAYGFVFRGRDRMGLDSTVSVTNKAVMLTLALPALAIGFGVSGVALAQGIAGAVALLVAHRLYGRVASNPVRATWQTAKEVFTGGSAIVTMMVAISIQP